MRRPLGFMAADPAGDGYQYIEDLACAYWFSEALFTALELQLFALLDRDGRSLDSLAEAASIDENGLFRLLRGLERMALVVRAEDKWFNSQASARYLVTGKPEYMGDFLLYRRSMQDNWRKLTGRLSPKRSAESETLDYRERNFRYVRAMDVLARQKGREIAARLPIATLSGPVLDAGGGAGSLLRALQARQPGLKAVLFDIPEVIEAARRLYPDSADWLGVTPIAGDFREHRFFEGHFGLVILANFLHAYGPAEARELLAKAVGLLAPGGRLLIHDYFPDRQGVSPQKGALYDLTMMLNTYNGACHESTTILGWLEAAGLMHCSICELTTDSSLILAGREPGERLGAEPWLAAAAQLGFDHASAIAPQEVVTGSWVAMKCRFGCPNFASNMQCPPLAMPHDETRRMLDEYRIAVLVEGQPPGRGFHEMLLSLERELFLAGYHKAFVFGAGPCTLCPECPTDGSCRQRDRARPSMEGAGIDVYTTAAKAGRPLAPVKEKGRYVKYMGLLLVE